MRHSFPAASASLMGALGGLCLLTGCASDPGWDNSSFGSTIRHQIAVQTANPGESAFGLDGQKAAAALTLYRTDVASPKTVDTERLGAVSTGSSGSSGSGQSGGGGK